MGKEYGSCTVSIDGAVASIAIVPTTASPEARIFTGIWERSYPTSVEIRAYE